MMNREHTLGFPDGFVWGTATASYQIEGAVTVGGRQPSIWDTFSRRPGAVHNGDTGDIADDHYHRYREDVGLLADLGVTHYRFSLAWPRLQPDGKGAINADGLDFYTRLVDELLAHNIQPWVTLYHWDLPQALEDAGGWPVRDTAERFAEYAAMTHEKLHDTIAHWTTLNEPWCSAFLGYAAGAHAPGRTEPAAALAAAHHLMLGHGLAVAAMRAQDSSSQLGITVNLTPVSPATEDPADVDAARRVDAVSNRLFLDSLLRGHYPTDLPADVAAISDFGFVQDADAAVIAAPIDFLGVNYYFREVVKAGTGTPAADPHARAWVGSTDVQPVRTDLPTTAMGWEIDPSGLYDVLTWVHRDYGPVPIYVTENGAAFDDVREEDGAIRDNDRIAFLDSHFRATLQAVEDGADVRGYFVWSLMDNFEWAYGYDKRFGLIHVDYATQARTPKDSARWFAEVTRRNGLAEPLEVR
ncbi:beta-glucosidase [Mycolicibacterium murale]|uniref:Beta-glucosidase n=1 Tax=Mycolicibacterium murale TaxID=182220 RepID=A0A7I9WND5_9MYCO|nr:beta-glucosidase [Mycolicibacterium murale]GFG59255.1 beta-glucosidase [Mycolicibacterium murale]